MLQVAGLKKILELQGNSTWYVMLFKEQPGGTGKNRTLNESQLADFPGYAHVQLVWAASPVADSQDHGKAQTAVVTFTRNSTGTPQTIYGIAVVWNTFGEDEDLTAWAYWDFETPVILADDGDKVERILTFYDDDWTHPAHG